MWASKLVTHQAAVHAAGTANTVWKYFPIICLYCEDDRGIPIKIQRGLVKAVIDAGVLGVREESYNPSHSPFLSMSEKMIAAVKAAWNSSAN